MIERRLKYVVSAGIAAALCVTAAAIAFLLRLQYPQAASAWDHVLLAAAAGATGALISQTIGIRSHHFDETPKITPADAVARVLIGSAAGAIILLLLNSGTLDIQIAGVRLTNVTTWQNALLVGFAAGFLERLVPNSIYERTIQRTS
jgi:4-amino-4-deoxy-L-arabinose transferase-like glycosyltransferase